MSLGFGVGRGSKLTEVFSGKNMVIPLTSYRWSFNLELKGFNY